jgi:A/G-specific adenine glycosylase
VTPGAATTTVLRVTDAPLATVLGWWDEHARPLPWRATRDVYAVWVSEVMSIQTTVERAAVAWRAWIERWPTVESLAAASLTEVLAQWQGLGYPRRARDLHRGARTIVASGWPDDLTELPGIGDYVAAAIRCFALEQPALPRDVNVDRVLRRRFPAGVDISGDAWRAGQAIMEFGQVICTARPRCSACPVPDGCAGRGEPAAAPGDAPARARRREPFQGSLRQRRGRLLAQVIAERAVSLRDADPEAAAGLADDGLVVIAGGRILAPD